MCFFNYIVNTIKLNHLIYTHPMILICVNIPNMIFDTWVNQYDIPNIIVLYNLSITWYIPIIIKNDMKSYSIMTKPNQYIVWNLLNVVCSYHIFNMKDHNTSSATLVDQYYKAALLITYKSSRLVYLLEYYHMIWIYLIYWYYMIKKLGMNDSIYIYHCISIYVY